MTPKPEHDSVEARYERCGFCQCGCGLPTTIADKTVPKHGYIKGEPRRFVLGHHLKAQKHTVTHGASKTPEHTAWCHIIQRCTNPNDRAWKYYGGRGITICAEWRHDFAAFLAHVGARPSPNHTIERINNDGNYEPGNLRWATQAEQMRNTRHVRLIEYDGRTASLTEWAKYFGVAYQSLQQQLKAGTFPSRVMLERKANG